MLAVGLSACSGGRVAGPPAHVRRGPSCSVTTMDLTTNLVFDLACDPTPSWCSIGCYAELQVAYSATALHHSNEFGTIPATGKCMPAGPGALRCSFVRARTRKWFEDRRAWIEYKTGNPLIWENAGHQPEVSLGLETMDMEARGRRLDVAIQADRAAGVIAAIDSVGPRAPARVDPLEIAGRSFAQCLDRISVGTPEWDGTLSSQARAERCIEERDTAVEWALWEAVDLEACRTATLDRAEASCAALLKYVDRPLSCKKLPSYCAAWSRVPVAEHKALLLKQIDFQKVPGAPAHFGEAMKAIVEARGRLDAPYLAQLEPLLGAVSGSLHKTCKEVGKGSYVIDVANNSRVALSCGLRLDRREPGRQVMVGAGKRGALKVDTDTCNIANVVECAVPIGDLTPVFGGDIARALALHRMSEQGAVSPTAEVVLRYKAAPALVRESLSIEPSRP